MPQQESPKALQRLGVTAYDLVQNKDNVYDSKSEECPMVFQQHH